MLAGYRADLAFALQTAKGSAAASATYRTPLADGQYLPGRVLQPDASTSTSRAGSGSFLERIVAEGEPTWVLRPSLIGLLLYGALGAKAVSGSGPYTHTFTVGTSLPWLTAWPMVGDALYARIADTKVRSLEINARAGGLLLAKAGLSGLTATSRAAAQAAALEQTDAFIHADAAGALEVEGVPVASISEVRLSIETGAEVVDTLDGPDILDGRMGIRIRTVQTITDVALWNRLHYGTATPSAGDPTVEDVLELGGSPAGIDFTWTRRTGRSLQVLAPRLVVADEIEGLEADPRGEPLRVAVTYTAWQPTSGSALTAVLVNGVASY